MNKPDISIIIPCYNEGIYLNDCLNSVWAYEGNLQIEIVLVNDGSTDQKTLEIIRTIENENKIKVIHKNNEGLSAARNSGIQASLSDFFIPLDADDCLNPKFIDMAFNKIHYDADIDIIYGNSQYFEGKQGLFNTNWNLFSQFYVNGLNVTALIKKDLWDKCNGYDESMKNGYEDWEFWINAAEHSSRFEKIDMIAFFYRIKENSMVKETTKKHNEILMYIRQKHQGLFLKNYIQLNRELNEVKNNRRLLSRYLIRNIIGKRN